MTGTELYKAITAMAINIGKYRINFLKRAEIERQLRAEIEEKAKIDISGKSGKARLIGMVSGIYILVMLLLATIVYGMVGAWIVVAIAGAICFVMLDKKKVISLLAGAVAVGVTLYLVYVSVIDPIKRAVQNGNVPGIVVPLVMAVLLVIIILVINSKYVEVSNKKIREINAEILANNAELIAQARELEAEARELDSLISAELTPNGWYPAKYATDDAAEFFHDYMKETSMDVDMNGLIAAYEKKLRDDKEDAFRAQVLENQERYLANQEQMKKQFNQMIDNQQALEQQMRFSNIIGMYNCYQTSVLNNNVEALKHVRTNVNITIR